MRASPSSGRGRRTPPRCSRVEKSGVRGRIPRTRTARAAMLGRVTLPCLNLHRSHQSCPSRPPTCRSSTLWWSKPSAPNTGARSCAWPTDCWAGGGRPSRSPTSRNGGRGSGWRGPWPPNGSGVGSRRWMRPPWQVCGLNHRGKDHRVHLKRCRGGRRGYRRWRGKHPAGPSPLPPRPRSRSPKGSVPTLQSLKGIGVEC